MIKRVLAFVSSTSYGYDLVASLYAQGLLSEVYVQTRPRSRVLLRYIRQLRSLRGMQYVMTELIDRINKPCRKTLIKSEMDMSKVKAVYFREFEELRHKVATDNVVIVVYGTRIMPSWFYKGSSLAINLHWGLAPYYRGVFCTEGAILNSDLRNIGYTLHELANVVDGGTIITQGRVEVYIGDTVGSINTRIHNQAKEKLLKVVRLAVHQKLIGSQQNLSLGKNYIIKDWTVQSAIKLYRLTPIKKQILEQSGPELPIFENPEI